MKSHLAKHNLFEKLGSDHPTENSSVIKQHSIASMFQSRTESDVQAVESPAILQIFKDLPNAPLPFSSRTLVRRIDADFDHHRIELINELTRTCSTIALSLDVWTSKNHKAILGVIGHWLTPDFRYRERVLEFNEPCGSHSGKNMAEVLQKTLEELQIEEKLLTITADNASNNETLLSELYFNVAEKHSSQESTVSGQRRLRFQGVDSYIRCLAHVLNLIENEKIGRHSALARLRIMALWILRTPQRRQQWKVTCQTHGLNDKFIEYDVETRWNSTYRMIQDALQAKVQVRKWIEHQNQFPPFSADDWLQLHQLHMVLSKFDEFTQLASRQQSQISLAIPIYYELHDMLEDAASAQGDFAGLSSDITSAISTGMRKYKKYYDLMDSQDAYYIALVLDQRFKTLLLEKELGPKTAPTIIGSIKETLHEQYPSNPPPELSTSRSNVDNKRQSLEARVLQKLQPQVISVRTLTVTSRRVW
ncbi:hypothetical protein ABHI18_002508 [Aspergillus niger]